MNIEVTLARYIVDTTFRDLTKEAVTATKLHLLHTLATMLGGSAAPGCNLVVDLVREWGGAPQSSMCVYGDKVPAHHAALANSTMAHALDFCNNDDRIAYKSSVCVVPVALAVAEARGGITGKDLLTAICVGIDLGLRLGLSIRPQYAHARVPEVGVFAGVAAAGKLLGLEEAGMLSAFGLAYCQVMPTGGGAGSLSLTKRLGPGLTAQAAILSALLAEKGYPSGHRVFDGPSGFFQAFHSSEGDLATLVSDLGKRFEITQVGPKPYPSCRFTHAPIDSALGLVRENNISSEDVDEVKAYLCTRDYLAVGGGHAPADLEAKRRPRGVVDAQFSVPWTVATAIVKRDVFIPAFTEKGILDPDIIAMAHRVTPVALPELDKGAKSIKPAVVEIKTKNGKVYSKRVDFPLGSPENPMPGKAIEHNFRRAAVFTALPFSEAQVEEIVRVVKAAESVEDARTIAALMVAGRN